MHSLVPRILPWNALTQGSCLVHPPRYYSANSPIFQRSASDVGCALPTISSLIALARSVSLLCASAPLCEVSSHSAAPHQSAANPPRREKFPAIFSKPAGFIARFSRQFSMDIREAPQRGEYLNYALGKTTTALFFSLASSASLRVLGGALAS